MPGDNEESTEQQGDESTEQQSGESLIAAGEEVDTSDLPSEWHAVLTVENLRTTDHRRIADGALSWRQLPIALFAQFQNAGHFESHIVGQITEITRVPWDNGMTLIMGQGTFDLGGEHGREAARMVRDQILRWGSIDMEVLEDEMVEIGAPEADIYDLLFSQKLTAAADGYDWYQDITLGRIMGYTLVAMPAFPQAVIAPLSVELDIPDPMGEAPTVENGLLAAGLQIPVDPPARFFEDPELETATPLTVDDNGRVFGHLALWETAHIGYDGMRVNPPHSDHEYAYFTTGSVRTADGTDVRVGQITFDTGHASAQADWRSAAHHYDHTGAVAADVVVGEDEFGIWFSGALRSTLTAEDVRAVRAAPLSGDWRAIGKNLELVAALSVNVPGFPVLAASGAKGIPALVAAGRKNSEQISLITAGLKPRDPMEAMAREIVQIKRAVAPLMKMARRELSNEVLGFDSPQAARAAAVAELKASLA